MELKKINYEITINAGNYQSIRYGMEYSVSKTEKIDDDTLIVLDALMRKQIQAVLEARKTQTEQTITAPTKCAEKASKEANGVDDKVDELTPNETPKERPTTPEECTKEPSKETPKAPKKERLTKDSNKLQAILNRMQQGVSIDKVLEFYEPDETAMQVLEMQEMLNNKNYEPKYIKKNEDK